MKQIQFDQLHKALKDAIKAREGADFVPSSVLVQVTAQNVRDENLEVIGTKDVLECFYEDGSYRGSIAPVDLTSALTTWFNKQ